METFDEIRSLTDQLNSHPRKQEAFIFLEQYRTEGLKISRYAIPLEEKEAMIQEARLTLRDRLKELLT